MYMAGHRVVFDRDEFGNDISHAVHKETGQTAKSTLRNRTWDLDVKLIPCSDVQIAVTDKSRSHVNFTPSSVDHVLLNTH